MKQYKIIMISNEGTRGMAIFNKLETAKNVFETVFKNSASATRSYSLVEYNDNKEIVLASTKNEKDD